MPSFALSNYWQGGREYLSSAYWPSYAASLTAFAGFSSDNNLVKAAGLLGALGTAPLLLRGHQVELKKQQLVQKKLELAVKEVEEALEGLDEFVNKYGINNIESIKGKIGLLVEKMNEMKKLVTLLPRGKEVTTFLETKIEDIVKLKNVISNKGTGDKLSLIRKSADDAIKKVNDLLGKS